MGEGGERMGVVKSSDSIPEQEFIRLVQQYQTALLRMCYVYLHDTALAEDAVQETFLKVYKAAAMFRKDCSEKTWLMQIAVNTCRDMRRTAWFRHVDRRVMPELLRESSLQVEEDNLDLTLAIANLPYKLKEVIMLRYYQAMPVTDIAAALGLSPSSVSGRLSRAKDKLRTVLERGYFNE